MRLQPMPGPLPTLGWQHRWGEVRGEFSALNDRCRLSTLLLDWVVRVDPSAILSLGHTFEPQGVSIVIVGACSRVALHSWPEHGIATLDISAPAAAAAALVASVQQSLLPILDGEYVLQQQPSL